MRTAKKIEKQQNHEKRAGSTCYLGFSESFDNQKCGGVCLE